MAKYPLTQAEVSCETSFIQIQLTTNLVSRKTLNKSERDYTIWQYVNTIFLTLGRSV